MLVINDGALAVWGPEDLLGPLAPGLNGSISIAGRFFPVYDLVLIVIGPVVLGLLWLLLTRTDGVCWCAPRPTTDKCWVRWV
ncbi:inner-membrane translocator [Alcaligenes sp. HPC1271]|nr:inner-membrane translocator [Alcaligenes sp. HPC1271]